MDAEVELVGRSMWPCTGELTRTSTLATLVSAEGAQWKLQTLHFVTWLIWDRGTGTGPMSIAAAQSVPSCLPTLCPQQLSNLHPDAIKETCQSLDLSSPLSEQYPPRSCSSCQQKHGHICSPLVVDITIFQ